MDIFSGQLDIDTLLLTKQIEPLSQNKFEILQHIQNYDVTAFNESEVRSYIIDPILRVLGYDKGTHFSTKHENHLTFLGQLRRPDYQMQFWEEDFWLLEAKKPQIGLEAFEYSDFAQALEYSAHPAINAALIVLCDGLKLEIFDREENVDKPVLHVNIKNIVSEFDKIRALLEPMQVWFFQKRRIVRQLDQVFNKEFVMSRVDEFSDLLQRRLRGKRNVVVENFRKMVKSDHTDQLMLVESASLSELSELYMKFDHSVPIDNAVNRRLIELSSRSSFHVLYRLLPDHPRAANDQFMAQTCAYLVRLAEQRDTVEWLPAWIVPGRQGEANLHEVIVSFLDHCLTYFRDYEPYRLILLAANAIQRIAKIFVISNDAIQKLGSDLHAFARFTIPEISWAQVIASPKHQLIQLIDVQSDAALEEFLHKNKKEDGTFLVESARLELKRLWELERKLLANIPNYSALLAERSLGEMRMIGSASVTWDNLAHAMLARVHHYPKWKNYLLAERRSQLEDVASTGSHFAKDLLGYSSEDNSKAMCDQDLADRFFLGDVETLRFLRNAYSRNNE